MGGSYQSMFGTRDYVEAARVVGLEHGPFKAVVEGGKELEKLVRAKASVEEILMTIEERSTALRDELELLRPLAARGRLVHSVFVRFARVEELQAYDIRLYLRVYKMILSEYVEENGLEPDSGAVNDLVSQVTLGLFQMYHRGLGRNTKVVAGPVLCFSILVSEGVVSERDVSLLFGSAFGYANVTREETRKVRENENPVRTYFTLGQWHAIKGVSDGSISDLGKLALSVIEDPKVWSDWAVLQEPELEDLPEPFEDASAFDRLLVVGAIRPDRLEAGIVNFTRESLGDTFVRDTDFLTEFSAVIDAAGPGIPILYESAARLTLTEGVFMVARHRGYNPEKIRVLHFGSMSETRVVGPIADLGLVEQLRSVMEEARKDGLWLVLENIHVMNPIWFSDLQRLLFTPGGGFARRARKDMQVFLSFEQVRSSNGLHRVPLPTWLIRNSLKFIGSAAEGLPAVLDRTLSAVTEDQWVASPLALGLAYLHAVFVVRERYLAVGWNDEHAFAVRDFVYGLSLLSSVMANAADQSVVPYKLVRYLVTEIGYGGFMLDERDERTLNVYAGRVLMEGFDAVKALAEVSGDGGGGAGEGGGGWSLAEVRSLARKAVGKVAELEERAAAMMGWSSSSSSSSSNSSDDDDGGEGREEGGKGRRGRRLEQGVLSSLGQLREIDGAVRRQANLSLVRKRLDLIRVLLEDPSLSRWRMSQYAAVENMVQDFLERLPRLFDLRALEEQLEGKQSPFVDAFVQEVDRANGIIASLRSYLLLLDAGLRAEVAVSSGMFEMMEALARGRVPDAWQQLYISSVRHVEGWFNNLLKRLAMLHEWVTSLVLPDVVDLSLLFAPWSYLSAIKQVTARKNHWDYDKLTLQTHVTGLYAGSKKLKVPKDGVLVTGMWLEGCKWEQGRGLVLSRQSEEEQVARSLYVSQSELPVVHIFAVQEAKRGPARRGKRHFQSKGQPSWGEVGVGVASLFDASHDVDAEVSRLRDQQAVADKLYECPVYIAQQRGVSYLFTSLLETEESVHECVLSGVAIILDV